MKQTLDKRSLVDLTALLEIHRKRARLEQLKMLLGKRKADQDDQLQINKKSN